MALSCNRIATLFALAKRERNRWALSGNGFRWAREEREEGQVFSLDLSHELATLSLHDDQHPHLAAALETSCRGRRLGPGRGNVAPVRSWRAAGGKGTTGPALLDAFVEPEKGCPFTLYLTVDFSIAPPRHSPGSCRAHGPGERWSRTPARTVPTRARDQGPR